MRTTNAQLLDKENGKRVEGKKRGSAELALAFGEEGGRTEKTTHMRGATVQSVPFYLSRGHRPFHHATMKTSAPLRRGNRMLSGQHNTQGNNNNGSSSDKLAPPNGVSVAVSAAVCPPPLSMRGTRPAL